MERFSINHSLILLFIVISGWQRFQICTETSSEEPGGQRARDTEWLLCNTSGLFNNSKSCVCLRVAGISKERVTC